MPFAEPNVNATTPLEHLAWASELPPLEAQTPSPLTTSQKQLLKKLISNPAEVKEHVRQQLQYWTGRESYLAPLTKEYRSTLDPCDKGTSGPAGFIPIRGNARGCKPY